MQASLTFEQLSGRRDHLHLGVKGGGRQVIAALSLLSGSLDTAITSFVLAGLRTIWSFDMKRLGMIAAIGLTGYLVGSFMCALAAGRIGRENAMSAHL